MEHFVWLRDQLRVQAEWRSASMECGEQCVTTLIMVGISAMPELCADNWGTMSMEVEVSYFVLLLFKDQFIGKLILVLYTLLPLNNLPWSTVE